jgi:hypothetical protein
VNKILVVIADGVFSHAYANSEIYIVDLDDHAEIPAVGAMYDPSTDLQHSVSLDEIDRIFETDFTVEFA